MNAKSCQNIHNLITERFLMIQLEPILLHVTYHLLKLNHRVSGKKNVVAQNSAYCCRTL